ncbi:MAG: hypothetical protein K0R11_2349 [Acidimicrobiales bacterium]|nr:hypothetical protein [Acidimicrobiales bacterium]
MRPPSETLEFLRTDPDELLARMAGLAAGNRGWINLRPLVQDSEEAPIRGPGLFGLFGSGGPPVPLCTWTPGERRRRGVEPPSVGVQHAAGQKVARRLPEVGASVPDGWAVVQDHPRRGLVVRPPAGTPPDAVLGWLLGVGEALCVPPVTGWWTAAVFDPG